jgi:hypothetical protein
MTKQNITPVSKLSYRYNLTGKEVLNVLQKMPKESLVLQIETLLNTMVDCKLTLDNNKLIIDN